MNEMLPQVSPDMGGSEFGGGYGGGLNLGGGEIIGAVLVLLMVLIGLAFVVFMFVSIWRLYAKAGRPGWAIFIPVYNFVEFFHVAWGSGAYFLFMLFPGVNVLVAILTIQKLSESFGHGIWYTLGLFFFPWIFIPVLAFGKSKHIRYQAETEAAEFAAVQPVSSVAVAQEVTAAEQVPVTE